MYVKQGVNCFKTQLVETLTWTAINWSKKPAALILFLLLNKQTAKTVKCSTHEIRWINSYEKKQYRSGENWRTNKQIRILTVKVMVTVNINRLKPVTRVVTTFFLLLVYLWHIHAVVKNCFLLATRSNKKVFFSI